MMSARIQSIELTVQHVRDRCQRMPVSRMGVSKRPNNTVGSEAPGYLCILVDIARIVIINEVVPERLAEDQPGDGCQANADSGCNPTGNSFGQTRWWRAHIYGG